jgi:hypothetical protein
MDLLEVKRRMPRITRVLPVRVHSKKKSENDGPGGRLKPVRRDRWFTTWIEHKPRASSFSGTFPAPRHFSAPR